MRRHSPRFQRTCTLLSWALRRFRADTRGTTAIELGMVTAPFFLLVLGIMTVGLQFLSAHFLEYGVEAAARKLRTGEAQKAGLTLSGFRELFCDAAGFMIACDDRLVIHVKSGTTFAALTPVTSCVTDGNLTPASGTGSDAIRTRAGGASDAVMVSACYQWDAGMELWQLITNLISPMPVVRGKPVLSAATAFRSEPFE
jgi:Flp pilus assembly protein TadG